MVVVEMTRESLGVSSWVLKKASLLLAYVILGAEGVRDMESRLRKRESQHQHARGPLL